MLHYLKQEWEEKTATRLCANTGLVPSVYTYHLPNAGIVLVSWCRIGERRNIFVHERAKSQTEIASEFSHLFSQLGPQIANIIQVIVHGQGEIHQVVEVHRIVLHLPNLNTEGGPVTCRHTRVESSEKETPCTQIIQTTDIVFLPCRDRSLPKKRVRRIRFTLRRLRGK